jgi:hypothetical protein
MGELSVIAHTDPDILGEHPEDSEDNQRRRAEVEEGSNGEGVKDEHPDREDDVQTAGGSLQQGVSRGLLGCDWAHYLPR